MFKLISVDEWLQEESGLFFVLIIVEQRLLSLVRSESSQVQSIDTEPVTYSDTIVVMSFSLGYLCINIIVNNSLVNITRGDLSMINLEENIVVLNFLNDVAPEAP